MKFLTLLVLLASLTPSLANSQEQPDSYFVRNQGQWNKEAHFLAQLKGLDAWVTDRGILFDFFQITHPADDAKGPDIPYRSGHVVKMEFEADGPSAPLLEGMMEHSGYYNYFLGSDPRHWASGVSLFGEVEVRALYPRTSARYYFENQYLRYDLLLEPGADPSLIRMVFSGNGGLSISPDGNLRIGTSLGNVEQAKPVAWQEVNGKKTEVPCSFILNPDGRVGFRVDWRHPDIPLVIDPLTYSTYLGGNYDDKAYGVCNDAFGNTVLAGTTYSTNFPTVLGSYDISLFLNADVFVTKLNAAGSALIYSTYIGGSGYDNGLGLAMDAFGNALVTGNAQSGYPVTTGAFDEVHNGNKDVFVTKLNATGTALVYSTYLGGSTDYDEGLAIAADAVGNAYVTGLAGSGFPVTTGAFDESHNGGTRDAFVAKLNPAGTALLYSTFLGGTSGYDYGNGIAVDASGNAVVTGYTGSASFPITANAVQSVHAGSNDVFVTRLNAAGSALIYSTFLGGMFDDEGLSVALDATGAAYVTGQTNSSLFPRTTGVFDSTFNGNYDIFVSKLNPAGTALVYSTYLGGTSNDYAGAITVDAFQNAIVTGNTYSTNFPTTSWGYSTGHAGYRDVFLSKLNQSGTSLVYSSFIGGGESDYGYAIRTDDAGDALLAGATYYQSSFGYPTTLNAYDLSTNGVYDAFLTKVHLPDAYMVKTPVYCYGGNNGSLSVFSAGAQEPLSYVWSTGATTSSITGLSVGYYMVTVTDANNQVEYLYTEVSQPATPLTINAGIAHNGCAGGQTGAINLSITNGEGPYTTLWSNGVSSAYTNGLASGTYTVTVTDYAHCALVNTYTITEPQPLALAAAITTAAGAIDLTITGGTAPYLSLWSGGQNTQDLTGLSPGSYAVTITDANFCTLSESYTIALIPLAITAIQATQISCHGANDGQIDLQVQGNGFPIVYMWSSGQTTQDLSLLASGTYLVTVLDIAGGVVSSGATITDPPALQLNSSTPPIPCFGQLAQVTLTASGGTSPYTGTGLQQVPAGFHSFTVTDAHGCQVTTSVNISQPMQLVGGAFATPILCHGQSSTVTIAAMGGTLPYSGIGDFMLTAGSYTLTVTDAHGCTAQVPVEINETAALQAQISAQPILCHGDSSLLTLTASGGVSPYSGTGTVLLPAGTWTFQVTDAQGCTVTLPPFSQVQPPLLQSDAAGGSILCHGGTAAFEVTASGGTPPFAGTGTHLLPAGLHTLVVTDQNGCTDTAGVFSIPEPSEMMVQAAFDPILCNGGNADVTLSASGGTSPYSGTGTFNLSAGMYSFTITDQNGCPKAQTVIVTEPAEINLATAVTNASSATNPDGGIQVTASGGTLPYTFLWSNGASVEDLTGLLPGTYTLSLTDGNGCQANTSETITAPGAFTPSGNSGLTLTCFPNPANQKTSLSVGITQCTPITLSLYSLGGEKVQDYYLGSLTPGTYTYPFETGHLAPGLYVLVLRAGSGLARVPLEVGH